jgi:hypothetical protein
MFAVTSERDLAIHAVVPSPVLLLVRDGRVVAFAQPHEALFSPLGRADAALSAADVGPHVFREWCPGFEGLPNGLLPAGDYEVVAMVTVTASPQVAALYARFGPAGGLVDMPRPLQPFGPGDWDCEDPGRMTPGAIECDPLALIDRDRGIVSLPYDASIYTADVRVTLVSSPHRFSVLSDTNAFEPAEPPLVFPEQPACADEFDIDDGGENFGMAIPLEHLWTDPDRRVFIAQLMPPEDSRVGELTFPRPLEVWVTRVIEGNRAGYDGPFGQYEVVVGRGTLSFGEGPLELDRSEGPTKTEVTVSSLEWCDGVQPGGASIGIETRVYVRGGVVWLDSTGTSPRVIHGSVDHRTWE